MSWKNEKYESMVGKHLNGFKIDADRERITFYFLDADPITFVAYGDCCSSTWIESVDMPGVLYGEVREVEDIDMPDLGSIDTEFRTGVDVVTYYGMRITTENGIAVIDYRKDSNGYYGGSLE